MAQAQNPGPSDQDKSTTTAYGTTEARLETFIKQKGLKKNDSYYKQLAEAGFHLVDEKSAKCFKCENTIGLAVKQAKPRHSPLCRFAHPELPKNAPAPFPKHKDFQTKEARVRSFEGKDPEKYHWLEKFEPEEMARAGLFSKSVPSERLYCFYCGGSYPVHMRSKGLGSLEHKENCAFKQKLDEEPAKGSLAHGASKAAEPFSVVAGSGKAKSVPMGQGAKPKTAKATKKKGPDRDG